MPRVLEEVWRPRSAAFLREGCEQNAVASLAALGGQTSLLCCFGLRRYQVVGFPTKRQIAPSFVLTGRASRLRVRCRYLPVPERFAVCGLLLALSLTVSFPVLVPVAVGVNVTLMVHLFLAVRLVVHVVPDMAKSPVVEIVMLSRLTLWLLVRVNVLGKLVVPTACGAYQMLNVGVSAAATAPVPVRLAVCGLLLALSITVSIPVLLPSTVGVKVTLIVQCALAARLVVQVVAEIVKSPVVVIVMPVSAMLWLLVRVNVLGKLGVPTPAVRN